MLGLLTIDTKELHVIIYRPPESTKPFFNEALNGIKQYIKTAKIQDDINFPSTDREAKIIKSGAYATRDEKEQSCL